MIYELLPKLARKTEQQMITAKYDRNATRSTATLVFVLVLLIELISATSASAAVQQPGSASCAAINSQVADLNAQASALEGQIAAHNSQSVDRTDASAVALFNARSAGLNAQRDALNARVEGVNLSVARCIGLDEQISALLTGAPGDWAYSPRETTIRALQGRLNGLGDLNNIQLSGPNRDKSYPVSNEVRPLLEAVRRYTVRPREIGRLQGLDPPRVGDRDLAFGNVRIVSRNGRPYIEVDHINPITELVSTPGFARLNARNMLLIINSPINLQWLSGATNAAKRDGTVLRIKDVDFSWALNQFRLRSRAQRQIRQAIDLMLEQQQVTSG